MAKIKDIAQLTGFSITTVSRVLNQDKSFNVSDETRLKIMTVAEELNYLPPSKRHKVGKTESVMNIGLVYWYSVEDELTDPYYLSIRLAIEKHCEEQGIHLHKCYLKSKSLDELKDLNVEGIIALGKYSDQELQTLHDKFPHIVLVDCWTNHYNIDVVVGDLKNATRQIINHFKSQQFKSIGFICGVEKTLDGEELLDIRLVTFSKEMKKTKDFNQYDIKLGKFTADSGYDIMSSIIASDALLDCYIVASDAMAMGCLKALNEHHIRVPDVVSIISYDNISLSQYTIPSLSTIDMNTKHLGTTAMELMKERLTNDREIAKKVMIPTNLILRDSSL
ncbi:MAG TPA: LacI family transcriptional regulator [Firmicutes bacterium]|nr:LacI family transcriptional regulator [Bacillota bacterium]